MLTEFLITVGVMCSISVILALFMVIADNTIANYGEVKININGKKDILVEGGKSLLSTLMEQEIFIPSACGGRGSCGFCKVKINSGAGDFMPTELPWLSEAEKKNKVRLSCQIKVKKELSIEIPEELFSVKQYKTRIKKIRDLTHDIKEVKFALPADIEFNAGQFVQIQVPEYELCAEPVYRAYSISSVPSQKNEVELEIRYVPNGICTTFVHKHLKEGDQILVNGPYGDFFLRDTDSDIVFIAGGSGMAPIKSILLDMAQRGVVNRKAQYFFGARSKRDLFLVEEMRELEKRLPQFNFIPALSEPLAEDNWTEETGKITDVVDKYLKGRDGAKIEAYLCGSPGMIDACVKVLTANGVAADKIYFDKFA